MSIIKTEWGVLTVEKSKLEEIVEGTFGTTDPDELKYLRDRLYAALSDTEKETWTKFAVFLSAFGVFYLIATNKTNVISLFGGIDIKDAKFLRQAYPFYIFYMLYQFTYTYIWSGLIQYQLDTINVRLQGGAGEARLHYFTFPANPHLFYNWTARHLGVGAVTKNILISMLAATVRVAMILCIAGYVYFVNIRDYDVVNFMSIISAFFGLVVLARLSGLISLYNKLVLKSVSLKRN